MGKEKENDSFIAGAIEILRNEMRLNSDDLSIIVRQLVYKIFGF